MDTKERLSWVGLVVVGYLGGTALAAWGPALWQVATGALAGQDVKFTYLAVRSTGITAYLLLTAGTLFGLGISTRLFDRFTARLNTFALHQHLAWLALGAIALHGGVLLFDPVQPLTLPQLFVPFTSSYRPGAVGLGILAMYVAVLLTVSFYLKPRLSHQAWRTLHYLSFALFIMATAHGVLSGTDTGTPAMNLIYWASGAAVLAMTLYRVLQPRQAAKPVAARPATPARPMRPAA